MTVWLNVRTGSKYKSVDSDLSALFSLQEALDALAQKLKVQLLTAFFDDTDVRYNMDESGEFEESEDGWPADAANWHDPATVLQTVEALRTHLVADPSAVVGAEGWSQQDVIEELDLLVPELQKAASKGKSVHLLVVM